ncbi:putative bifunctional diguanylate cyclase/phosphodiesterase [Xenophilus sp.]|uniref:putative bifunctional diguanylate cyclase/phosphodiesterase n=1 Tax=Xenophilus sp. TaxID=1873499 RepID=UPI0037DD7E99
MNPLSDLPGAPRAIDADALHRMVRTDQWVALRRSVRGAVQINMLLSLITAVIAWQSGRALPGLAWLALSLGVNAVRLVLLRLPARDDGGTWRSVDGLLRLQAAGACVSGCVWSLVAWLCAGYTGPGTVFYLVVQCGICAGAVTYGIAYAALPVSFTMPPLLVAAACLAAIGDLQHIALSACVLLYLAALLRAARQSEVAFRIGSRTKNEATALAEQLAFRATHDSLTGLLNRDGFTQAAAQRLAPSPSAPCLLMLDLDGFKAVNDAFGHQTGDRVLRDVAQWLCGTLAGRDALVGRWGGDEFVVLYAPRDEGDAARTVAEALIRTIPSATQEPWARLGLSIGAAVAQQGGDVAELLAQADEALYAAKRAGPGSVHLFDAPLAERMQRRRDMERDLGPAIAAGRLALWYQPILDAGTGRVHSLEALLRWEHPRHGWIDPADVIFTAASTGLAEPLMRFILDAVCGVARALVAAGRPPWPIAVNVSPREMSQLAVDRLILSGLARHGLRGERLIVEITEEVALDTDAARSKLAALAAAGVTIAVDDFGVGYSSLALLRNRHVGQVKIDRSFIAGLASSPDSQVVVQAILQLGRALRIQVVAEGVESQEELDGLRRLGCQLVQGYHLARPAPLPQILQQLGPAEPGAA